MLEYLFLGALSAVAGVVLAVFGGWLLSYMVFEVSFSVPLLAIAAVFIVVSGLTMVLGMLNSRRIAARPPLEILRVEP